MAFVVNPLSLIMSPAPTYPAAWAGRPQWGFVGALGVIAAIQYENSPVGPYSELIYTAGFWKPNWTATCGKVWAPNSIVRIWVDSSATCDAAHHIWGIPKQLASFEWNETGSGLSVAVTAMETKEVLFAASAKDTFLSVEWFKALLPTSRQTVHWPINANQQRHVPLGTVPAYRVAEAALPVAHSTALTTQVQVNYTGAVVNSVRSVFINQLAMTGHEKQRYPLRVLGLGVSIKSGDANPIWSIPEPQLC